MTRPGLTAKTAFFTAMLLCITLFAVGTGLYSFYQYQAAIANITGPKLQILLTASKLVQQSDAIISSSSTLLLATSQAERRRALFEISDRAEWMDKLILQLQGLSSASDPFREIVQAKENLVKNLGEVDTLVEQRIAIQQSPVPSTEQAIINSAALATINRELKSVMQNNKLYSTDLGIAVGYHVAKVKEAILDNASNLEILMNRRRFSLITAAVLSVTTVLIIAFYIHFSIVKRIVRLQQAVHNGAVLPSQIPLDGHDEITRLAYTVKRYVEKSLVDEERILDINKELSFLAAHDSLTKLYNRRQFETIATELTAASSFMYCIGIIDIDHFKEVNDTYGHKTGDVALVHLAMTIKSGLRTTDILARYGGEEFVVMMLRADKDVAFNVFERIRRTIENTPLQSAGGSIHMTASFGIAQCLNEEQSVDECLRCADMALYVAKNSGRNTVVVHTPELGFPNEV